MGTSRRLLILYIFFLVGIPLDYNLGVLGLHRDRLDWKNGHISARQGPIVELSAAEIQELFNGPPPVDHVILFYTPWNNNCRIFMDIYKNISHHFSQEDKKINFSMYNCSTVQHTSTLCHDYNVANVPNLVYVAGIHLQRHLMPENPSTVDKILSYILPAQDNVTVSHATRYKGDLFLYEEVIDWVSCMYAISTTIGRKISDKGILTTGITYIIEALQKLLANMNNSVP